MAVGFVLELGKNVEILQYLFHENSLQFLFNRAGVAGAVVKTPSSFILYFNK